MSKQKPGMRRTNSTVDLETLQNQQQLSELEKIERNIRIEDRNKNLEEE